MSENCKCDCNLVGGIDCKIESCVYHSTEGRCHAGSITVGGECDACHCDQTACKTFKARD